MKFKIKAETYIYDNLLDSCIKKVSDSIKILTELRKETKELDKNFYHNKYLIDDHLYIDTVPEEAEYDPYAEDLDGIFHDDWKADEGIEYIIYDLEHYLKKLNNIKKKLHKKHTIDIVPKFYLKD